MAQGRRIRNNHLTSLLAKLHQLLYDADDELDEIEYHRIHQDQDARSRDQQATSGSMVHAPSTAATAVLHLLSDVVSHQPLASSTFRDMFMYPWPWGPRKRRKLTADTNALDLPLVELDWGALGRRIREATSQLRVVSEQVHRALQLEELKSISQAAHSQLNNRRLTTSYPAGEHKMFGRNGEKDSIIEVLTDIRCCSQSRLLVLPVVGNGGIGKTTLLQHVYHDNRIRSFFHTRMWICVSHCHNFSVLRLTREMLEADTAYIFGDEKHDGHQHLQPIGREIARKLNDYPLAAKSVGALLRKDLTIEHWSRILESRAWEEQNGTDGIMSILRLSYEYLPFHLQRCFSYCSLFPKGYRFLEKDLVLIWNSQGFIDTRLDRKPEEVGHEYMNHLVCLGFFQKEVNPANCETWYLMHDIIHDLAINVSSQYCLTIDRISMFNMHRTHQQPFVICP
ncbi:unnamed protein product [Miscanthus lutarioriparius]|uniref:NB-ARC domain-containing protein n=1 Tax=Miscanthus lutarioriparius TaxID=422564 RepID=A0A811PCT9_9POAL|nr:unnamed protein product [Miscanthus lutarioriparius]